MSSLSHTLKRAPLSPRGGREDSDGSSLRRDLETLRHRDRHPGGEPGRGHPPAQGVSGLRQDPAGTDGAEPGDPRRLRRASGPLRSWAPPGAGERDRTAGDGAQHPARRPPRSARGRTGAEETLGQVPLPRAALIPVYANGQKRNEVDVVAMISFNSITISKDGWYNSPRQYADRAGHFRPGSD